MYIMIERKVWKTSSPAVSICRDGEISFNKALTQMFLRKGYEWALLLFDPEDKKIAVRPLTQPDRRAYRITYHKNGVQAWVCSKSFLKSLGWEGRRYQINAYWSWRRLLVEFDIPDWMKRSKAKVVVMEARRAG
jgi:hypothetical protein